MVRVMKGQAVFEFVVAAVLFFAIVFYMINFLNVSVSAYGLTSRLNDMESRAVGISDYLVRVNLTKKWPVLSYDRIKHLNDVCNQGIDNYFKLAALFDVDTSRGGGMKIRINNGTDILDCSDEVPVKGLQRAEIKRFALSENNKILNISVMVW